MAEQQTPVMETPAAPVPPTGPRKGKSPATHEQKQKRRKMVRRAIALVVTAAILGGGGWALKKYIFTDDEAGLGEVMTMPVMYGSIQSTVSGMGNARAKNSATVTPDAGYRVLELFVSEGDYVEEGQLLYNLDDTAAQDALRNAQENVRTAQENVRKAQDAISDYDRELEKMEENLQNLTITAPHDGKLTDINRDIRTGDDLSVGTAVATVINDTKLRLHLYYSWAYEGQISVGQSARITLPASMSDYPATVEQVNMVKRVVPEGSVTFEVVFVMDNPGTLTEGMTASANLTGTNGEPAYPYESGKLEYYETTKIAVKVAGPVEFVSLMNYADVKEGQTLVRLGDKDALADISAKQNSRREALKSVEDAQKNVDNAVKAVEEAQEKLDNYHAVSPIAGQVISCGLMVGEEVSSGASIYIADTATMMIDISIDERNIGYVSKGMMVDIQDMMGNYYMGVVDSVSLSAKAENGVASFPAVVVVDNPDGMLMTNSYVDYTFVASQSDNCLVVPIQAVKNVTLPGAEGDMMGGEMMDPGMMDGDLIGEGDVSFPIDVIPEDGDMADPLPEGGDDALPEGDGAVIPEGGDAAPAGDGDLPAVDGDVVNLPAGNDVVALPAGNDVVALPAGDLVAIPENAVPQAMAVSVSGGNVMFIGGSSSRGPSAFQQNGTATVCFVKGEPDERALEADESWEVPEGFFAVLVETGLSDSSNVEIKSGLNEGEEVFTGYITNNASNW